MIFRRWVAGLGVVLALCVAVVAQPLPGLFNPLLQTSSIPPTITFTANASSTTNSTSYSFATTAIGAAAATRCVAVGISGITDAGTATSISSGAVGGIATSVVVQLAEGQDPSGYAAIIVAAVPTGTTATVEFVFTTTMGRIGIGVWAIYDAASCTAAATASSVASPGVVSLNTQVGDVIVAAAFTNSASGFTWAGVTENYDDTVEGAGYSGGSATAATAETPRTITSTYGAASRESAVSASWR